MNYVNLFNFQALLFQYAYVQLYGTAVLSEWYEWRMYDTVDSRYLIYVSGITVH